MSPFWDSGIHPVCISAHSAGPHPHIDILGTQQTRHKRTYTHTHAHKHKHTVYKPKAISHRREMMSGLVSKEMEAVAKIL